MKYAHDEIRFRDAVSQCFSIAGVIRYLNRAIVGSNYRFVKSEILRLGLDTEHWSGRGAHLAEFHVPVPIENLLVVGTNSSVVRKRLVKENTLSNECSECGISNWRDKPLSLHLDHINGNRKDNRRENLRFLCPNCHSQTSTYCGRNKKITVAATNCSCGEPNRNNDGSCPRCVNLIRPNRTGKRPRIIWSGIEKLESRVKSTSVNRVSKELGVAHSALRNQLSRHARMDEGTEF